MSTLSQTDKEVIFVSGIDTDAGKSYCTAWLAMHLAARGRKVITQKFIQTGNDDMSEDILLHRKLTGSELLACDLDHTTAPIIFSYPCSPQLAAKLDGREINLKVVDEATAKLLKQFDTVLIEGAGGLMVPLADDYFTIDYIASRHLPVALTVHGGLGSINHAILSIDALLARGIELRYILYNQYFDRDETIATDTRAFLQRYIDRMSPATKILDVPKM